MLPTPAAPKVYAIRRGNKTVSIHHRSTEYVLGFRNVFYARTVLHNLHPEPRMLLLRDVDNDIGPPLISAGYLDAELCLNLDVSATLFIPKLQGNPLHPLNDGCFHIHQYSENEFLTFPLSKNLGTVMPYMLVEENNDEFMFKTLVMDPVS